MSKKLAEYEAKRDFTKASEPGAKVFPKDAKAPRFVVQEHHARSLHWDFRLERDAVRDREAPGSNRGPPTKFGFNR